MINKKTNSNKYSLIRIDLILEDIKIPPTDISKFLKMEPTASGTKGSIISLISKKKWRKSFWKISSKEKPKESFKRHLDDIVAQINSNIDRFVELSKQCKVFLNCVIKMYGGDNPYIKFDKEYLKLFNRLSLEIEFDIYNFGNHYNLK